jgi:hypothetical protein
MMMRAAVLAGLFLGAILFGVLMGWVTLWFGF